jgi:chemotaxis protein CheX
MSAEAETATVVLPSVIDLKAVAPLHQELLAARGRPLSLDASGVSRLGALGLQVLMSARATWAADGQPFAVSQPSEEFNGALQLFAAPDLNASDFNAAVAEELRP